MATPGKGSYQRGRNKIPGAMNSPIISRRAGILVAMALELPGSIIGGLFIGYLLDEYFKTSPWLMMALTALGFTGACVRLVRWARLLSQERNQTNRSGDDPSVH